MITILTFQDFEAAKGKGRLISFIRDAIEKHRNSDAYKVALAADEYDAQRNTTINETAKRIYNMAGAAVEDTTASNIRIASNFFAHLNRQRCTYSLGNGVTFDDNAVKEKLGKKFDTDLFNTAYFALIHGTCFGFWNVDKLHIFKLTEFVPLWDEMDGSLKAGIRWWCIDWGKKPVYAVLYEEDGYTKYQSKGGRAGLTLEEIEPKHAYKQNVAHTEAGGDEVIGEENYSALPIVPLYGNRHHQSTLVGMRAAIDSYDLIRSGFANDLTDCAEVYWLIGNALGMTATGSGESDDPDDIGKPSKALMKYLENIRRYHVAVADTENSTITPYTQEIPYAARDAFLNGIKAQIYRDFGAFDAEQVAAGNITATQIIAAYDDMDKEADAFEYQIIEFVQQILTLNGMEPLVPSFNRARVANENEQVQMLMQEAAYLDEETVIRKMPNLTPDEADAVLERKGIEDGQRFQNTEELEGLIRDMVRAILNERAEGAAVVQDNNGGYRYEE